MSATDAQLTEAIRPVCAAVECWDDLYSLPDTIYPSRLGKRLKRVLADMDFRFAENRRDCDKFARLASTIAFLDHAMFSRSTTGIAVGVATVLMESSVDAHAVIIMVHRLASGLVPRFYEPQLTPRPEGGYLLECLRDCTSSVVWCRSVSI